MRQFVILLMAMLASTHAAKAQTYTEHLQQKTQEGATVTVSQSKEIDELVNGTTPAKNTAAPAPVKPGTGNQPAQKPGTGNQAAAQQPADNDSAKKEKEAEAARAEAARKAAAKAAEAETDVTAAVDTRKKVMRGSHKVDGYRVQVYAGGNSREDKIKAEEAGRRVKAAFPGQPVYVHFYSPRWICRMGNYRDAAEANRILKQVRQMGYKQATVVKGKITVQY